MNEVSEDICRHENRRTGKTTNAIEFVKKIGGTLICYNRDQAKTIERQHNIRTATMKDVLDGKLRGVARPTYYDQECLMYSENLRMEQFNKLNQARKELVQTNTKLKIAQKAVHYMGIEKDGLKKRLKKLESGFSGWLIKTFKK